MAIQQMALMAYKAPPAGGDSAYLIPYNHLAGMIECRIQFYPGPSGNTSSDVGYFEDNFLQEGELYTWKTGPNPATDYGVILRKTANTGVEYVGNNGDGGLPDTLYQMTETADQIFFKLAAAPSQSTFSGYLVIVNVNNPTVELANVSVEMLTNTNA